MSTTTSHTIASIRRMIREQASTTDGAIACVDAINDYAHAGRSELAAKRLQRALAAALRRRGVSAPAGRVWVWYEGSGAPDDAPGEGESTRHIEGDEAILLWCAERPVTYIQMIDFVVSAAAETI